jgi:hypothetical protein
MEDNFAESWTGHVVYVDQQLVRSYDFTREEAEATTQRWISAATSTFARPTPCEYCNWCANKDKCSALVLQSKAALADVDATNKDTLTIIKDRILADPLKLADFAKRFKFFEKEIAEPLVDALKERLAAGDDIPGWKVSTSAGREYVEAAAIAKASENVSKETLGGKMTGLKFREFCAAGGVEVDESAIKAGAPITTLRQVKVK